MYFPLVQNFSCSIVSNNFFRDLKFHLLLVKCVHHCAYGCPSTSHLLGVKIASASHIPNTALWCWMLGMSCLIPYGWQGYKNTYLQICTALTVPACSDCFQGLYPFTSLLQLDCIPDVVYFYGLPPLSFPLIWAVSLSSCALWSVSVFKLCDPCLYFYNMCLFSSVFWVHYFIILCLKIQIILFSQT